MRSAEKRGSDRCTVGLLGGFGAGALTLLALRDPHVSGSYGFCPFRELTGLWCPLCGGLRATHDLTQLRIVDALSANILAVVIVSSGVAYFCYWAVHRWRGTRPVTVRTGARGALVLAAVAVAFTVVRNLAFGAALAP